MSERPRREQKALRKYYREHSKKTYEKKKKALLKILDEKPMSLASDPDALNDHDPLAVFQTLGTKSLINTCVTEPQFPLYTFADSSVPVSPTISDLIGTLTPASPCSSECSSPITVTSPNSSISRRLRSKVHTNAAINSIEETPKKQPCARMSSFKKYKYRVNKEFKLLHRRIAELQKKNQTCQRTINRLRNKQYIVSTTLTKDSSESSNKEESAKLIERFAMPSVNIKEAVVNFYEDDENSRMCPGKRDYKVQNKVRKQKRFATESLRELHKKFLAQHPEINISSSLFCRLRPFWVIIPKVAARETCSCQTHENFNFVVSALHKHKIVSESSANHLLEKMCCDPRNVSCLTRVCVECRSKKLTYLEFDNRAEINYMVWEKQKKTYIKNGTEKTTLQTVKVKKPIFPKDLVEHFEKILYPYMSHIANIISQYRYIKKIKAELSYDQCIIHCDFSQNYCAKYANEVQSFHFGSSRQQISLHTSVLYYMKHGKLLTQSFCTVSECLRHDAVAIWEHLVPILRFLEDEVPEIQTLMFISDSPSAQYRNRKMFFIISCLHWNFPSLRCVEWNYTEHGHGKGAPDGVGGCLKCTADKIVARGHDIPDMITFVNFLKQHVDNIRLEVVNESGIFEKEMLIPDNLTEFRGTLSTHQVIWIANDNKKLAMRKLSCCHEECLHKSVECPHGLHAGFYEIKSADYMKNRQLLPKKSKVDKLHVSKKSSMNKADSSNKPQILPCKIIKPTTTISSLDKTAITQEPVVLNYITGKLEAVKTKNIKIKKKDTDFKSKLSDIDLSENDSLWKDKINIENLITPTLADTNFSELHLEDSDEDEFFIF